MVFPVRVDELLREAALVELLLDGVFGAEVQQMAAHEQSEDCRLVELLERVDYIVRELAREREPHRSSAQVDCHLNKEVDQNRRNDDIIVFDLGERRPPKFSLAIQVFDDAGDAPLVESAVGFAYHVDHFEPFEFPGCFHISIVSDVGHY